MQTTHIQINGDSRQMNLIPDKSVHLIITSPPYWQLKDYGTENQIGFSRKNAQGKKQIDNIEVIEEIKHEIERLNNL